MTQVQTIDYRLVVKFLSQSHGQTSITSTLQVRHRHPSSVTPGVLVWGSWQDVPTVTIDKEGKECSQ